MIKAQLVGATALKRPFTLCLNARSNKRQHIFFVAYLHDVSTLCKKQLPSFRMVPSKAFLQALAEVSLIVVLLRIEEGT